MLDIKFIRESPEKIKTALKKRGSDFDVEYLLQVDEKRRKKIKEYDDLRATQNKLSEDIAKLKGEERGEKVEESKKLKATLGDIEFEGKTLEEEFNSLMRKIPNIPEPDVPVGADERENVVVRETGGRTKFSFKARDYMEIGVALDIIDTERAAKVSGSRFGYLKGDAVILEMALVQFAFDRLSQHGFIPVIPPVFIKEEMMRGMGYVDSEQDFEERYFFEKDKLFLVGTAEQSIGPMHAGETFDEGDLPRRYAGFSTSFRREAGSYGKDTHGILRVHQFDKVEMFIFATSSQSRAEHEILVKMEEGMMQSLGLPYRLVRLCTGDISQPSASTFDIETWLPGQNGGRGEYRETHSSSNTTDFQARRLAVKVRRKDGKVEYAHMLNGTAFAIGRMIIAILENYQREDGTVAIPKVLRPYTGHVDRISKHL